MSTPSSGGSALSFEDSVANIANSHKTVGELAFEVIKDAIVSGRFAPGERLRQEALASAIGISRIPVRSALIQLESEGLVSFHPRRGAVVRSLTVEQVREIYELRELLETHALRTSMKTMTPERIDRLRELAARVDAQEDGPEFVEARVQFYRELYDAAHKPQLVKMVDELRDAVGRYLLRRRVSHGHSAHHGELVEAVASGDAEVAVKWLSDHLASVLEGVEEIVSAGQDTIERPRRKRTPAAAAKAGPKTGG
jgi:DNA-binding GntR family transcriptional regulator